MNRETWLNQLAEKMAPRFTELGFPLPGFYVSIGFPSDGKNGKAAAECWHSNCSADGRFQIHIRPDESDSMMIAGHLAHELTHAAVGFECKHKGDFARVVMALGLQRPLTSTVPGDAFKEWAQPFLDELGQVPHASLKWRTAHGGIRGIDLAAPGVDAAAIAVPDRDGGSSNAKPKQRTRLMKCTCGECGYTVRVTQKWLDVGPPHCPHHGPMDTPDEPGDE